jgi:uncharacterized protein DUF1559
MCSPSRRGFSLVDLVVVLAMFLILAALLLPAVQNLRQAGHRQETTNNLKQVTLALINCADTNRGFLPPACDNYPGGDWFGTLHVHILPYAEEVELYKSYHKAKGKGEVADAKVAIFLAAEDNSNAAGKVKGVQNFAANLRLITFKGRRAKHNADMPELAATEPGMARYPAGIPDGTSNTVAFATKYALCGDGGSRYAAEPNSKFAAFFGQHAAQKPAHPSDAAATYQLQPAAKDCRCAPLMAQSFAKSLLVSLCDGSVRGVAPEMSAETWNRALHPADAMPLGSDW